MKCEVSLSLEISGALKSLCFKGWHEWDILPDVGEYVMVGGMSSGTDNYSFRVTNRAWTSIGVFIMASVKHMLAAPPQTYAEFKRIRDLVLASGYIDDPDNPDIMAHLEAQHDA